MNFEDAVSMLARDYHMYPYYLNNEVVRGSGLDAEHITGWAFARSGHKPDHPPRVSMNMEQATRRELQRIFLVKQGEHGKLSREKEILEQEIDTLYMMLGA